jgi:hypothetical protein
MNFSSLKRKLNRSGAVAYAPNPSSLGGRDRRIKVFRPAEVCVCVWLGEGAELANGISESKLDVAVHTSNPSCVGDRDRIAVQG